MTGREMMRLAANEHERVLGIPLIVRVAIVRVKPTPVLVPVHVEEVQVAVGVRQNI
jgi:hypothetical protein